MTTIRSSSCRVRRWGAGAGLAAAATIGMGTAHADDSSVPADIGLLTAAETDIAQAFSLNGQTPTDATIFPELEAIQTPLLSSDNSFVSGVGEALFNGPDQQLAQASEAFLSASEAFSSGTPSITTLADFASTGFQLDGAIFGEIPSTVIGKLTDQIFDVGGFDSASASATTDLATSADSPATLASADTTPADLLSQATTTFTDADQVLAQIPTVGDAPTAGLLEQQTTDLQEIAQLGTSESALSSYDNGALTELLDPLFNSVNQGWDQASEAVLNADEALQTAAASGSDTTIDTAIYGLLGAQLESPIFSSDFIDLSAHFLTGIDPFSAGLDTASAIDPGIVADLLSSIGF